jgi:cell division protein FtsI/penicillin-binding protein 2
MTTNITEKAPRGAIYDRYGVSLVSNKVGYSVVLQRAGMTADELNEVAERVTSLLNEFGCEYYDTLPITYEPYEFDFDNDEDESREEWFSSNTYKDKRITPDMSAEEIINEYKKIYGVSSAYTEEQARRIIGLRYEAELHGFNAVTAYTLADDVSVDVVTRIKENKDLCILSPHF